MDRVIQTKITQECSVWDPATQQSRPARLEYAIGVDERGVERHFLIEIVYLSTVEKKSARVYELQTPKPAEQPSAAAATAIA